MLQFNLVIGSDGICQLAVMDMKGVQSLKFKTAKTFRWQLRHERCLSTSSRGFADDVDLLQVDADILDPLAEGSVG
ncbi:hypothetical protein J6590_025219 [Homalodisca vitripennis]|nr:hypothetical protein J6590_025219 [Homalodisca vitripennis]